MVVFPNAKINLGLHVVSKRSDGFHNIETCFLPVGIADILEFIPASEIGFQSSGISIPGNISDNLCLKAWELLNREFEIPAVSIHLHKKIPIGGGLGGGSSDAAFMLKGLNELFGLGLSQSDLENYAAQLGSDCAFFIANTTAIASGRGEVLEPVEVDLSAYKLILVNPGIHVTTAEAFSGLTPKTPVSSIAEIMLVEPEFWQGKLINDFEETVFARHPEIEAVKNELLDSGAVYASMSGSGSTVFAFFKQQIPVGIVAKFEGMFVWSEK